MSWCGSRQQSCWRFTRVTVSPDWFSRNTSHAPFAQSTPQLATVFSGLKKVMRLDVSDALDRVTWFGEIDLPGTMKSPPLPPGTCTPRVGAPNTLRVRAGWKSIGVSME